MLPDDVVYQANRKITSGEPWQYFLPSHEIQLLSLAIYYHAVFID